MQRGWKVFWGVCIATALIGVGLCTAGVILGFNGQELERTFKDVIDSNVIDSDAIDAGDLDIAADASKVNGLQSYTNVTELSIDMGAGTLIVKAYDGDSVKCDFEGLKGTSEYSMKQDEEELDIDIKAKRHRIFSNADVGKVILYVPQKTALKKLSLDVGAGDVILGNIIANEIDLDCGAGRIEYVSDRPENFYNYDIQCGVGEVSIGENQYSGLGTKKEVDNGSDYQMNIDCGVGEVVIKLNQK